MSNRQRWHFLSKYLSGRLSNIYKHLSKYLFARSNERALSLRRSLNHSGTDRD